MLDIGVIFTGTLELAFCRLFNAIHQSIFRKDQLSDGGVILYWWLIIFCFYLYSFIWCLAIVWMTALIFRHGIFVFTRMPLYSFYDGLVNILF